MITILGASGFIGSNLVYELKSQGRTYYAPERNEELAGKELGDVIYCIGMTADFRTKPFETVEAHVCKLKYVLENCSFNSFTYLSSTRLYIKSQSASGLLNEESDIVVNSNDPFDLFAASKITGELLLLNSGLNNVKIARVSNVYGADLLSENFISSVVRDAIKNQKVELHTSADSAKDYISIEDVCTSLLLLAGIKTSGVYNVCFGKNTTNDIILKELNKQTGAEIIYDKAAKRIVFEEIDNSKLISQIDFKPQKTIVESLPEIIQLFRI